MVNITLIIEEEIEDRLTVQSECGDEEMAKDLGEEIEALQEMLDLVRQKKWLDYEQYSWLSDLTASYYESL
jgi:hypothetical protein